MGRLPEDRNPHKQEVREAVADALGEANEEVVELVEEAFNLGLVSGFRQAHGEVMV